MSQLKLLRRWPAVRAEISSPADVWLCVRMLGWALIVAVLRFVFPLPKLVQLVHTPARSGRRDRQREQRIVTFARWIHRIGIPAERGCLQRSLVAYRFLARASAEPELWVGVRKLDGSVAGHAWITVDAEPIGESAAPISEFVPVVRYGPDGVSRPLVQRSPI